MALGGRGLVNLQCPLEGALQHGPAGVLFTIVRRTYATAYDGLRTNDTNYSQNSAYRTAGPHSLRRTYDVWRKLPI